MIPFVSPTSVIENARGAFQLTVKVTGCEQTTQRADWTFYGIDDSTWENLL